MSRYKARYTFTYASNDEEDDIDVNYSCNDPEFLPQVLQRFANFLESLGYCTDNIEYNGQRIKDIDWS